MLTLNSSSNKKTKWKFTPQNNFLGNSYPLERVVSTSPSGINTYTFHPSTGPRVLVNESIVGLVETYMVVGGSTAPVSYLKRATSFGTRYYPLGNPPSSSSYTMVSNDTLSADGMDVDYRSELY